MNREESLARYGTPSYTGWGVTEADADFKAKGGTPGGGSSGSSEWDDFVNVFSQTAIPYNKPLPPIKLRNIEEYEKESLEELRPYYERILAEEGGDVERAKKRIEEDYTTGNRYRKEDLQKTESRTITDTLKQLGWNDEDAIRETDRLLKAIDLGVGREREDAAREISWLAQYTFPEEKNTLIEGLNKRGLMDAGLTDFSGKQYTKLNADQTRRQEAIELALRRYEENAGIQKTEGLEDINRAKERADYSTNLAKERTLEDAMRTMERGQETADTTKTRSNEDIDTEWSRRQFLLGEEKKEKAASLGSQKRQEDYFTKNLERENAYSKLYG